LTGSALVCSLVTVLARAASDATDGNVVVPSYTRAEVASWAHSFFSLSNAAISAIATLRVEVGSESRTEEAQGTRQWKISQSRAISSRRACRGFGRAFWTGVTRITGFGES